MSDPAERFIHAATAPMADNPELQIAARQELVGLIENTNVGSSDSLDTAAARLEEKHSGKWRYILYAVTGIVSAAVIATSAISFLKFRDAARTLGFMGGTLGESSESLEKQLSRHLTPQQKLLLLGDTQRDGRAERIKALWESQPDSPAFFADYATVHLSEHKELPEGFLEMGRKLDPDNAWFPVIAAADAARQALDSNPPKTPVTSPGGVVIKTIKDRQKMDEALTLLHQGSSLKRFDNYQISLLRQRVPLLPKSTDNLDQIASIAYFSGLTAPNMQLRHLADIVAAKAIDLAKAKDRDGFKQLLTDWETFTHTYLHSDIYSLVETFTVFFVIQRPLKALSEAASDLDMKDDSLRLNAMNDRFEAWKAMTRASPNPNADMARHSGTFAGMSLVKISEQSSRAPLITAEELKPGRLAEHSLAGRAVSLLGWVVLGVAALAAGLYRFRCGALTRRLSDHLASLLRPVDWLWIIVVGIVLPMIFYVVISRFTPLGGREWSMKASFFTVPSGQFISMFYLMALLPLVMIRRRLAVRGGAVGLAGGKQMLAWIAVASGVLALPVFGLGIHESRPSESVRTAATLLLGLLQLYLLVAGIRAIFSRQSSLLRRATISRLLLPVYASAMLAMMVASLLFHAEEKHWISHDRLLAITEEACGATPYEYNLAQIMKQETIDLVEQAP